MAWLQQFLNRNNTCREQAASVPPEAATPNPPKIPGSTTVMQLVAEETIMAVAQWLVNLVNHHIQAKPTDPIEPTPTAPEGTSTAMDSTTVMEELLSKFGKLVEQSYEREQKLIPLENRLQQVEAALTRKGELKQLQECARILDHLNQRLVRVEDLAGRVNVNEMDILAETTEQLTQHIDQSNSAIALLDIRMFQLEAGIKQTDFFVEKLNQVHESMAVLEHRMSHLEKLLSRFEKIPEFIEEKFIEGNRHETPNQPQLTLNKTFLNSDRSCLQNGSSSLL